MRHGQIGTQHRQRVIFIWEGTVAVLPEHRAIQAMEWADRHTGRYDHAVKYWKTQNRTVALMWSLLARTAFRVDVCVTSRNKEFAKAVGHMVQEHNWPVGYVFCATPEALGRELPTMPDVSRVYYGLEEQRWAFGPHGYFLGDGPITVS